MLAFPSAFLIIFIYLQPITAVTYTNHVTTAVNGSFNFILNKGDKISSTSQVTALNMQADGNFVLYWYTNYPLTSGPIVLFASGTTNDGAYVEVNANGNMMVKDSNDDTIWETATSGHFDTHPHHLIVDEECAYLMDKTNEILWSEGNCYEPFPTFRPPPAIVPTAPSRGSTQYPTTSPNSAPTVAPTPAVTFIDDVWTDDFTFDGINGFGWSRDDTVYNNQYHGPYLEGTYWLTRWFQCSTYSTVTIEYKFLYCNDNDHGDITVYINGLEMDMQGAYWFNTKSDYAKHSECEYVWRELLVERIGNLVMTKHEAFYVDFRMHSIHWNDAVGVSDVKVTCGPAISNSPTPEPSQPTNPTKWRASTPTLYHAPLTSMNNDTDLYVTDKRRMDKSLTAVFVGLFVCGLFVLLIALNREAIGSWLRVQLHKLSEYLNSNSQREGHRNSAVEQMSASDQNRKNTNVNAEGACCEDNEPPLRNAPASESEHDDIQDITAGETARESSDGSDDENSDEDDNDENRDSTQESSTFSACNKTKPQKVNLKFPAPRTKRVTL